MKLKKGLANTTDNFWYDLFEGGYLNPEDICEDKEDAKKVREAIRVLDDYKNSCEEQIEDFLF
jgi:hypothetical protein